MDECGAGAGGGGGTLSLGIDELISRGAPLRDWASERMMEKLVATQPCGGQGRDGIIIMVDGSPGSGKTVCCGAAASITRATWDRARKYLRSNHLEGTVPPCDGGTAAVRWSGPRYSGLPPDPTSSCRTVGGASRKALPLLDTHTTMGVDGPRSGDIGPSTVPTTLLEMLEVETSPKRGPPKRPPLQPVNMQLAHRPWTMKADVPLFWGADGSHVGKGGRKPRLSDYSLQHDLISLDRMALVDCSTKLSQIRQGALAVHRGLGLGSDDEEKGPGVPPPIVFILDGSPLQTIAFCVHRFEEGRLSEIEAKEIIDEAIETIVELRASWGEAYLLQLFIIPPVELTCKRLFERGRVGELQMSRADMEAMVVSLETTFHLLPRYQNQVHFVADALDGAQGLLQDIWRYGLAPRHPCLPTIVPAKEVVCAKRLCVSRQLLLEKRREMFIEKGHIEPYASHLRDWFERHHIEPAEDGAGEGTEEGLTRREIAELLGLHPGSLRSGSPLFRQIDFWARFSSFIAHEGPFPTWQRLFDLHLSPIYFLSDGVGTRAASRLPGILTKAITPDGSSDWKRISPDSGFYIGLPLVELAREEPSNGMGIRQMLSLDITEAHKRMLMGRIHTCYIHYILGDISVFPPARAWMCRRWILEMAFGHSAASRTSITFMGRLKYVFFTRAMENAAHAPIELPVWEKEQLAQEFKDWSPRPQEVGGGGGESGKQAWESGDADSGV